MEQNTETSPEQEIRQVTDKKVDPEQKKKILLVLDESINAGRESTWSYEKISEHHKQIKDISRIGDTIDEKKKLFDRLDSNSFTYQRILDAAKLALQKLKAGEEYNYYSADLILKFLQLEEVFAERKLKSKEVRFIDDSTSPSTRRIPNILGSHISKPEKVISEVIGTETYIGPKVSGKKLESMKKKEEEGKELSKRIGDIDDALLDDDILGEDEESSDDDQDKEEVDKEDLNDAMDNL